ncbi:retinoic acid receptor responder protein 2 isoform 3-T3 [Thomomys bottae]
MRCREKADSLNKVWRAAGWRRILRHRGGQAQLSEMQLSETQHKSLQVAMEEFHKHPLVQWAFQKTSINSVMDMRKRKCLACIKLGPEHHVLGRMVHCPIQSQGHQETQRHHCNKVERAGEDSYSMYLPGQFAFLKSGPSK